VVFDFCLLVALAFNANGSRDPWLWPFSRDSIWNLPIGSKAEYIPAGLTPSKYVGVDREQFIRLKSSDPMRQIFAPSGWNQRWPGDRTKPLGTMPVPDDLIIPDAHPPETPNACTAFLAPDGRTIYQLEPTCRLEKGGPIVGYPRESQDLIGPGIYGTHWGSGLSTIGGSIRLGELTSPEPIHHAIKINIWGQRLNYSEIGKGFRWPADRSDNGASKSYQGKNPRLVMGSQLALKPDLTPSAIGIKSLVGKKLFAALQDYGAYVSDDSGWDDYDLCMEAGVEEEVRRQTSLSVSGSSGEYFEDMMRLVMHLSIVDNNTPTTIGGGGVRRRPLAPPFRGNSTNR